GPDAQADHPQRAGNPYQPSLAQCEITCCGAAGRMIGRATTFLRPGTGPRRRGHVETAPSRPATTKSRLRTPPRPAVGTIRPRPGALEWQEAGRPAPGRL